MVGQLRRRDASPSLVLLVVCAGVVLASLDLFIVNVALPEMARDLDAPLSSLSWVLNGYAIAFASLLVLFGRLAERRSRELGFLVGVLVFTLASAACGLATSVEALVAFRVVQGAGAALLTPASLSLVLATAPDERRHSSVRAWTAVGGLAAALGPVVGGLLVAADWRWVFLVNVPIGLAALYVGWRRLPHVPGHPVPRPDALGAGLLSAGVAGLTLALVRGEDWGWGSTATLATLGISVVLLSVFVGPLPARPQPARRARALPCRRLRGLLDRHDAVLGLVRRDAPVARAVDAGRLGLVGAGDWPGRRAGAADGPAVLLPRRGPAHRALRPGSGRDGGHDDLRRWGSAGGWPPCRSSRTTSAPSSAGCS